MTTSTGPLRRLGVLAAAAALTTTACTASSPRLTAPEPTPGSSSTPSPQASPAPTGSPAPAGTDIFARLPELIREVEPSVVTVFTPTGLGSGVVYRADGTIVTNEHVVRGATDVEVGFADGRRVPGRVLAADAGTDLAVVRAERQDVPAARFQPRLPQVGEFALALGSPLGFENTATAGIISGLGREVPGSAASSLALVDLIQTDAAISPGNSGGALVNSAGEVVGINDAYIPPAAGAVSIGFAIPTATVLDVVEQLLATGSVTVPFLGIQPGVLTPQLAEQFGLTDAGGVLVLGVVPDGPAAAAGLRPGDVLVQLSGERVRSVEEFLGTLRGLEPGQSVPVTVVRNGTEQQVQLTLSSRTR